MWNIPLSFLPWSIFSIAGLIFNKSDFNQKDIKFILVYFPLLLVLILSFFSTKLHITLLQISSILSLNAYVGIQYLFSSNNYKALTIFIISKLVPLTIFLILLVYFIFFKDTLNFNTRENILLILGLISFGTTWSFIKSKKTSTPLLQH